MLPAPRSNIVQHCAGELHVANVNNGGEQRKCMVTADSVEIAAMFVATNASFVCWNGLRIPSTEHAPAESWQPLIGLVRASVLSTRSTKSSLSQLSIQVYVGSRR